MVTDQKNAKQLWVNEQTWKRILLSHARSQTWPNSFGRKHERLQCEGAVDLAITSSPRPVCRSVVNNCGVVEASAEGMSLMCGAAIPPDARLAMCIRLGDDQVKLRGTVIHCRRVHMTSYRVGIRLQFGSPSQGANETAREVGSQAEG